MSKKARRERRVNLPPEAFRTPVAAAAAPGETAKPAASPQRALINWKDEYGAVLGDIKRTGIIAAILMAAMVALSFVIR